MSLDFSVTLRRTYSSSVYTFTHIHIFVCIYIYVYIYIHNIQKFYAFLEILGIFNAYNVYINILTHN